MFKQALFNLVKSFLSAEIAELINKFRELNGDENAEKLKSSFKSQLELLKPVTDRTKTKVDDNLVDMLLDGIEQAD